MFFGVMCQSSLSDEGGAYMKKALTLFLAFVLITFSSCGAKSVITAPKAPTPEEVYTTEALSEIMMSDNADDMIGKIVEISGTVAKLAGSSISLSRENKGGYFVCSMSKSSSDYSDVRVGDAIVIVGTIESVPGNVLLEDCYFAGNYSERYALRMDEMKKVAFNSIPKDMRMPHMEAHASFSIKKDGPVFTITVLNVKYPTDDTAEMKRITGSIADSIVSDSPHRVGRIVLYIQSGETALKGSINLNVETNVYKYTVGGKTIDL